MLICIRDEIYKFIELSASHAIELLEVLLAKRPLVVKLFLSGD